MTNRKQKYSFLFLFISIISNIISYSKFNEYKNITNPSKQIKQHSKTLESKKCIIFDVGNTLFKVSTFGMAREIGLSDFMLYNYWDKQDPHKIQKTVFKILEKLKPYPKSPIHCYSGKLQIPQIMCDWFAGKISSAEISNKVKPYIEKLNKEKFFKNKREKRLIENTLHAMFDPYILAKNMKPILKAVKLVHELKTKGNDLFILSNWDPASFNQLQALGHAQRMFSYFKSSNILISGKIGLIKPDPEIFKYLLKKFKLKASDCIFIDDQLENIEAAKKLGIHAILLEDFNYNKVRNELKKLNVL